MSKVQNPLTLPLTKAKYSKVGLNEKASKMYWQKKATNTSNCFQSMKRGHCGTVHTSIAVPSDSTKSSPQIFSIDTNVDIVTTTSRTSLTYLLPRINACILLFFVVVALITTNTLAKRDVGLQANIDQVTLQMSLLTQHCHRMKLTLDEMIRRSDESKTKLGRVKHVVEREASSTATYDNDNVTVTQHSNDTQMLADSNIEQDIDQSDVPVPENVESKQPKLLKLDPPDDDKIIRHDKITLPAVALLENSTEHKSYEGVENREFVDGDFSTDIDYDESESSFDQRGGREKRSNGRGILSAHFNGAFPEATVRDGGLVAPWFLDESASGSFGLSRFNLREGKGAVQVTEAGLYYIYAQVYYLTNETMNSFWLNVRQADKSVIHLALCSTIAWSDHPGETSEVSCFTSAVRYLTANQTVFLQQRERNRLILMRDGQTFLGLVRLHSQKAVKKS